MKNFSKAALIFSLTVAVLPAVNADSKLVTKKNDNQFSITAQDIKRSQELAEQRVSIESASTSMRCMVDTVKYDRWGINGWCMSASSERYATAYFKIDNAPSNFYVYWSDSRCNGLSTSCALPIISNSSITLSADVLNKSNNTFTSTAATAEYVNDFY